MRPDQSHPKLASRRVTTRLRSQTSPRSLVFGHAYTDTVTEDASVACVAARIWRDVLMAIVIRTSFCPSTLGHTAQCAITPPGGVSASLAENSQVGGLLDRQGKLNGMTLRKPFSTTASRFADRGHDPGASKRVALPTAPALMHHLQRRFRARLGSSGRRESWRGRSRGPTDHIDGLVAATLLTPPICPARSVTQMVRRGPSAGSGVAVRCRASVAPMPRPR